MGSWLKNWAKLSTYITALWPNALAMSSSMSTFMSKSIDKLPGKEYFLSKDLAFNHLMRANTITYTQRRFMQYKSLLLMATIFTSFFFSISCMNDNNPNTEPLLGGQCDYKNYSGEAEIVSLQKNTHEGGGFLVKFSFHPSEQISQEWADPRGKVFELLMSDMSYPDSAFVEKYSLKPGQRLDCVMRVIVRGTCTPILFDFPSLDLVKSQ